VRILKFFLAVAAALLIHLVGVQLFPAFPRFLDVFVVVVVLNALTGDSLGALLGGLLVGLLQDTLAGGLYGLYGIADTIVGYATARLAQRLVIQRATGVLGIVSFAAALQQVILVALSFLLLPDAILPNPLGVAMKAAISGAAGMLAYVAGSRWRRGYESRRRGRMSRLRLS
jgi:rod shape-determining protein MreD